MQNRQVEKTIHPANTPRQVKNLKDKRFTTLVEAETVAQRFANKIGRSFDICKDERGFFIEAVGPQWLRPIVIPDLSKVHRRSILQSLAKTSEEQAE